MGEIGQAIADVQRPIVIGEPDTDLGREAEGVLSENK